MLHVGARKKVFCMFLITISLCQEQAHGALQFKKTCSKALKSPLFYTVAVGGVSTLYLFCKLLEKNKNFEQDLKTKKIDYDSLKKKYDKTIEDIKKSDLEIDPTKKSFYLIAINNKKLYESLKSVVEAVRNSLNADHKYFLTTLEPLRNTIEICNLKKDDLNIFWEKLMKNTEFKEVTFRREGNCGFLLKNSKIVVED